MLGEPYPTPADFRFSLWRFPVEVYGLFWVVALLLGWNWIQAYDVPGMGPGRLVLTLMWIGAVFVTILVHEAGHALAFWQFGIVSSITLYHFGGFARPIGTHRLGISAGRLTPKQDIWIAVAGPLIQLLLALVVLLLVMALGYFPPIFFDWIEMLVRIDHLRPMSHTMNAMVAFLVWPSVYWALFNLLPVWPLDGGRIAVGCSRIFFGTAQYGFMLSLVTAIALAIWSFRERDLMFGMFAVSFAVTSYQMLEGARPSW